MTDTPGSDCLAQLAAVEGLDAAVGLFHVGGNEEIYIGILRQFCRELASHEAAIDRHFVSEEWKHYTLKLHAMKGLFATIGMGALSQWAARLEHASRTGDTDSCRKETGNFCQAMHAFRKNLCESSLMDAPQTGPRVQTDTAVIAEKLGNLRDACLKGDCDQADAISAELKTMAVDPETDAALDEICNLSDSLDYDDAARKIDALLQLIINN